MSANTGDVGSQVLRPAARYVGAGLAALLGIPVCSGLIQSAHAAEYYAKPSVKVRSEFNDNPRLTTAPHDSVWGVVVDLDTELGVRTERSAISATPRLRFSRYPGEKSLDGDDQFVSFASHHDTEQDRFQLDGEYRHDSTLVRGDDPGDLGSELELSGIVQDRVRRDVLELTPSWTRALTDRTSIRVGGDYQYVNYQARRGSGLVDFDYGVLDTALTHRLTDKDQVSATLFVNRFRAFAISSETTGYGLLTRYDRQITDTLNAHVGVGLERSQSDFIRGGVARDATDTTLLVDAGFDGELEKTQWALSYTRNTTPTGGGDLVERNGIAGSITRRLTPRLNGTLLANASFDRAVGESNTFADRKLYSLVARLYYRLTEDWSLAGAYRFTHQDRDSAPSSAESNAVLVTLRYDGLGWSASR